MSDKQKNLLILGIMLALVAVAVYLIYPPSEKTKLGLDLQGGLEVILQAQGDVTGEQMNQAELVVRNRVDKLGVSEPAISTQEGNQISVGLAGVKDPQEAMNIIGKTALLEFKKLDPTLTAQVANGTMTEDKLPPDKQLLFQTARDQKTGEIQRDENGQPIQIPMVVDREVLMTGDILSGAQKGYDSTTSAPKVEMSFTDQGSKTFADATERLANSGAITGQTAQMAIILDDEVISAPTVKEKIVSDKAEITGTMSNTEVENIVLVLQTGALPVELKPIHENEISATLGSDSLRQGLIAGAVGLAIVMIFLLFYYRLLGVVADVALVIYGVLFYAALNNPWHPATLTLPGIAGMMLTIGVAADANVVIFERIKEEVKKGKTIRSAVSSGYSKGFKTILDANAVTLITALIIFEVATAGVKGFALTLMIGVVISMFTAVLATRAMLALLANLRMFNSPTLMGIKVEKEAEA